MKRMVIPLVLLLFGTTVLAGCRFPLDIPGTRVEPTLVVSEPTPSSTACTPLPQGMKLRATFQPPAFVRLHIEGLEANELITFVTSIRTADARYTAETVSPEKADPEGNYTTTIGFGRPRGVKLAMIEGEVRVSHGRGVACAPVMPSN